MKNRAIKKGDTLIEVTLAVGIFSMVAVAVLAVMNSSASSAQTALEATLTREEIDAQADALRFIHSAYVADKNNLQQTTMAEQKVSSVDSYFAKLWEAIITNTVDVDSLENYPPNSCSALYSSLNSKAFVLNTRQLGELNKPYDISNVNNIIDNIYIPNTSGNSIFNQASTYPRLVYADDSNLTADFTQSALEAAEGIYIIPVPEQVSGGATPSYYDFYIRSCWYGIGDRDSAPSTISTVMRLYNPDAIKPTITETCTSNVNYLMVDTNMYINGSNSLSKKGVEGINIEFEHTPKNDDPKITTGDHNKCLYTGIGESPGFYQNGPSDGISFDTSSQNTVSSCSPLERLKAKTGEEDNGPSNFALDRDYGYKGGDFWYPVHVGDKLDITIKSDDYYLTYGGGGDPSTMNPFICEKDGVTCNFCKVSDSSTSCGGNAINYKYRDIGKVINDNKPNRVEIHFTVNGCAINDTTEIFGNPKKDSISINTNWTQNP